MTGLSSTCKCCVRPPRCWTAATVSNSRFLTAACGRAAPPAPPIVQLGTTLDALTALLDGLATVITWHRHIAGSVLEVKLDINDNVESAHEQIRAVENNSKLNAAQRTSAITAVVTAAHGANTNIVIMAAARILATRAWKPPDTALQDLLDQKVPPPAESPPASPTPGDEVPTETDPALPGPGVPPPPAGPRIPPRGGSAVPPPVGPALPQPGVPAGVLPANPGAPGLSPVSAAPAVGMPRPGAGHRTDSPSRRG